MQNSATEVQQGQRAQVKLPHPANVATGLEPKQTVTTLLPLGLAAALTPLALQKLVSFQSVALALLPDLVFTILIAAGTWSLFRARLRMRSRDALAVSAAAFLAAIAICWPLKKMGLDESDLFGPGVRTFLLLVLYAPLVEEVLFRYALWVPIEYKWGPRAALVTTSVLFSLSHLTGYFDAPEDMRALLLTQGAVTLAFGFVIGTIYLRTRSVSVAMLGHAFANLGAFAIMQLA